MRKFWKIFSFLFVIVFLISLSTCIILSVGSTTVTTFTNNEKSRREIYYRSSNKLANTNAITIKSIMPYTAEGTGQTTEATITCTAKEVDEIKSYDCKMISKLLDSSSNVIRTSYFPGDGYQYTLEGQNQTKAAYANTNLVAYFTSLYTGATNYLNFLAYDNQTIKTYSIVYKTNITFDINSFALLKDINVSYTASDQSINFKLGFNKNDYLSEVYYKANASTLNISYKKTNLGFPVSFSGYQEA